MNILKKLNTQFVLFDGAFGTMLQKMGLKPGQLPEQLNITDKEKIISIHSMYLEAGCDVISTNTFGAHEHKLKKAGLNVEEVIKSALANARSAIEMSGKDALVAFDTGSTGLLLAPMGTLSFDDAYEMYKKQALLAEKYGADLVLVETMTDIAETRIALLAFKENTSLPVICSMSFDENKRTLTGTNPETMSHILQSLGADAIGANCSLGPKELIPVIEAITKVSSVPVIVQANAGLPVYKDGISSFSCGVDEYIKSVETLVGLGATIIGGCCGTDPTYIKAIKEMLTNKEFKRQQPKYRAAACSPSKTVYFENSVVIVGERINPTGNKTLRLALKEGDIDAAVNEAIEQKQCGAHILDVNVSVPGIDEAQTLKTLATELAYVVNTPLQFDSVDPVVLESAVRIYPGRAIINSVSGKESSLDAILPIAKKYGTLLVCLCMDDDGIPLRHEDRIAVAEKIIKRAEEYGINQENLFIDCLVLTASAQQSEVLETIKAITLLKSKYDLKTILGVSNVSYGLPKRELLNTTFLSIALSAGLNAAIIDPKSEAYTGTIKAFSVIAGLDKDSTDYVKTFAKAITQTNNSDIRLDNGADITKLILEGNRIGIKEKIDALLKDIEPVAVIETHIVPALNSIGNLYEKGRIFLPQLIRAAESASVAFAEINQLISAKSGNGIEKGTIALATVKGDVHDIGKNLVKVVLESYGYKVIDLGKDVDPKLVVETVQKHNIKLVGLSALMTTTLPAMEQTIKMLHQKCPDCYTMVGGAVLTEQYALKIGANYYCKDALAAVKATQTALANDI